MNDPLNATAVAIAQACMTGAETHTMSFPQIVAALMDAGFESYAIDFRRATATFWLPDGRFVDLTMQVIATPVAANFDASAIQAAIKEAQQQVPGYTYQGFCSKAVAAGCTGYLVSFSGRRVLYIGRTAQTHVEHFPT